MGSESYHYLTDDDVAYVRGRYEARVSQLGVTPASLHSGGLEKDLIRYAVHAAALRAPDASVLDIGCGLGGFYAYLRTMGFAGQYTGVDIVPAYVEYCRGAHLGAVFELNNPLGGEMLGEYDSIVMCQALNTRLPASNNLDVLATALEQAFRCAKCSVSFDMLSTYVDYQERELFYYPPDQILAIGKKISRWVVLRHDYRPYEFCIQLFHHAQRGA